MAPIYFYVWRLKGKALNRQEPGGRKRLPRYRHTTVEAAMTEAERLSNKHPESRFVVLAAMAEVGPKEPAQ